LLKSKFSTTVLSQKCGVKAKIKVMQEKKLLAVLKNGIPCIELG